MGAPFFLAPMAEISHRALRELIEDFGGCDCYFSEMISAAALLADGPYEKWYIDNDPCPKKLTFQLIGSDPQIISAAAAILDNMECAGIDINMGCSAPLIRKSGAGAAWMSSIDRAGELISKIRPQVKRRLSVKLRTGFKDDLEYLVRFCRRLEEEGVELITLHPRTVMQKFKRLARWEYVAALKQELKIPVAGNGDITSASQLIHRANSPCDAVMVGRAAIQKPWIFAQAKEELNQSDGETIPGKFSHRPKGEAACAAQKHFLPFPAQETVRPEGARAPEQTLSKVFALRTPPPLEDIGIRFLELLIQHQPPDFHISRAKRFFSFFCDNLQWGTYLKNQINREDDLAGIERIWRGYFIENKD